MFRILIVEDIARLLEALREAFQQWFPDSKIEVAQAVDDALQLIQVARASGWFYDVAVLDLMLPRQPGAHVNEEKVDDSLCRAIKETMHQTLVIHITGYAERQDVLRHLEDFHDDAGDPQSRLTKKDDLEFWDKLKKKAKEYLYGQLIEGQMDKLFGPYPCAAAAKASRAARDRFGDPESLTLELATLFREITAHWDDLNEKLRRRIQETLNVDTQSRPIRISLLG